jgi:hypothetical protein
MAFVIHGRDPRTGEKSDPFFSNATTEELARNEATTQGLVVDRVEREEDHTPIGTTTLSTMGAGTRAASETAPQYEFGPYHNQVIGGVAWIMRTFGIVLMVLSILYVAQVMTVPREFMPVPMIPAVVALILGGLLIYGAEPFKRIVRTQGQDVDHLMEALRRLRFTFELMTFVAVLVAATAVFIIVRESSR